MRLDVDDEARHKEENAGRGAVVSSRVEIEGHVEQPLERIEHERWRMQQLVEEESEGRGEHRIPLGRRGRDVRGGRAVRGRLPRPWLKEGGLEHLLQARGREGAQPLLVGKEVEQQRDAHIRGGEVL